jgi:spermidine/putrescine transport system permease protein
MVFIFLYAPIFVLIVFSFNASKSRTIWSGFTLNWYKELFSDTLILNSFYTTILVAVLASISATVLGTAAAVGLFNMKKLPKTILLSVNNIPVTNPDIITGVSLMLLFVFFGTFVLPLKLGFGTLLLSHITFNIPYVVLSVAPKLRQLNKYVYEAALDLGATPGYAFRRVILPEIMPGVINGLIIAFTMSIDDFVISYFTSGSSAQTLAMTIYAMTRKRISPKINALSTILFVSVLLLLIVINLRSARELKKDKQEKGVRSFI